MMPPGVVHRCDHRPDTFRRLTHRISIKVETRTPTGAHTMTTRYLSLAAVSMATAGLFACSSDSSMTGTTGNPSAAVTAEAAMVASDAMNSDAQLMMPSSSGASLVSLDDDHGDPSFGCHLAVLRFMCPPRVAGGLTITRSITFFDAAGAAAGGVRLAVDGFDAYRRRHFRNDHSRIMAIRRGPSSALCRDRACRRGNVAHVERIRQRHALPDACPRHRDA